MKIVMVSSEAVPFAKTGGLADAVSALAKALSQMGHDVRVIIPRYYRIDRKKLSNEGSICIHIGLHELWCAVYKTHLPDSDVPIYFIDHELCYGRDGIYGDPREPDFHDNPLRFSLLSHAVFELCRKLNWFPDILHAHDWAGALSLALLRFNEKHREFLHTSSVLTIHNIGYQGIYPKDAFLATGVDWNVFYASGLEDWGNINFLKSGIICADAITTVSPTYAQEIQHSSYGFRMDGILRERNASLFGIVNGVDTGVWNPKTDPFIPANYDVHSLAGKRECKKALQQRMGLPVDEHVPIVGMVCRLTGQKGVGELFGPAYGSAYSICRDMHLQFIILGSGEKWCEQELHTLAQKLPQFKAYIGYDESLSHLIEAGSDFFLMPSQYEPCGLNQMYSSLYGTLPIVRNTGGLHDTVFQYNEQTGEGTGFMFDHLSPQSIYDTVGWAMYAWYNKKEHIKAMQKRGMQMEFGWNVSAQKYHNLYHSLKPSVG